MQESAEILKKNFERIKNMGWVKEKARGKRAGGITFELLLRKYEDTFPIPDFDNIEIKVMNDKTKTNLHLFNLTPDGDYLFPIKRILYELGCPVKNDCDIRRFYCSFNCNNYTKMIFGKRGIISVNYEKEKVELLVYNNHGENTNIDVSWSFDYLKERLELKLKYLAFIRVSSCIICGEGYYHYHKLTLYKLKDFNTFINLINRGIIEITFKIGTHKSGNRIGKVYDHGTDFSIKVEDLELLYDKLN